MESARQWGLALNHQNDPRKLTETDESYSMKMKMKMTGIRRKESFLLGRHLLRFIVLIAIGVIGREVAAQTSTPASPNPWTISKVAEVSNSKPIVAGGSFELQRGVYLTAPWHVYLDGQTWQSWEFGALCGVANRNSVFVNQADLSGIDEDHVAFMEGGAGFLKSTVTFSPAAGSWRLVYKMANRVDVGMVENLPFVEVLLNGAVVGLEAPRHTDFQPYTTRLIDVPAGTSAIVIEIKKTVDPATGQPSSGTALIDEVRLERVRDWRNPQSWIPNGVPGPTDVVYIPAERSIAFSGDCKAASIKLEGELLAAPRNSTIVTKWIAVLGLAAHFEVGRELVPFQKDFLLTLRGGPSDTSPYASGTKFLMAMDGGTIDLHGAPRKSWTILKEKVDAGATSLTVKDASGWEVGDSLVITGSTFNRLSAANNDPVWTDYNEKVKIKSIAQNPMGGFDVDIEQTPPAGFALKFQYSHLGGAGAITPLLGFTNEPSGVPTELDQSAEVANLTRNVKVQGDVASASYSPKRFGGHIMLMHCSSCTTTGSVGRFSNVELERMGQEAEIRRYPIHFHMQKGHGAGQFVKNCSIHETYNRMITIHATDSVVVEDNVGYRNQGHALFLEDGSEMYNVIQRNLIMSTLRPLTAAENPTGVNLGLIPSDNSMIDFRDRSPAAYWITNPHNVFVDNVAAGTVGSGFWIIPPRLVLGPSLAEPDLANRTVPIELPFMTDANGKSLFRGNRAHDCRLGFDINDSVSDSTFSGPPFGDPPTAVANGVRKNMAWNPYRPDAPGGDVSDPSIPRSRSQETALDLVAYGCFAAVYGSTGGDQVIYDRMVIADCNRGTDFACYHTLLNSVVVEKAALFYANSPAGGPNGGKAAVQLYDGAGRYENTVFRGFKGGSSTMAGARGGAVNHPNHTFTNVYFPDALGTPPRPILAWPSVTAIQGSFLGYSNVTLPDQGDLTSAQNQLAPSKWGGQLFDETGDMSQQVGVSIVRNVPIMATADRDEFDYVNPAPSMVQPNAIVSPHRWGHLRLVYPELLGTTSTPMDFVIHRTSHLLCQYTGGGSVFSPGTDAVGFAHVYNSRQHKQIPVIVNTEPPGLCDVPMPSSTSQGQQIFPPPAAAQNSYYVYTIDHIAQNFLTFFSKFELVVDDVLLGDVAHFRLADLDGKPLSSIEARFLKSGAVLGEYTDFTQFMAATEPALYRDATNGEIHLRVPVRTGANGSTPAGRRNYSTHYGVEGLNLPSSRWRNETITISWI